jgi:hypothetical protein
MKKLIFILLSLVSMNVFAEDASELLNKYITYYNTEYEAYLKSKYELNVSEYYWKRIKDLKAFGLALNRKSNGLNVKGQEIRDEYYKVKYSDMDASDRLSILRAKYFDLRHQKDTVDQYLESLSKTKSSVHLSCNEEHVQQITKNLDPELMYSIPQYMFDPSGAPKLDMHYYFSLTYNYGQGFESAGGAENNLTDEQGMIVYGGATAAVVVAMCFGVEEPTTLSAIFAGTAAILKGVVDLYTSVAGSKAYAEEMEKLQKQYSQLNAMIATKHKNVSQVRSDIIKKSCESTLDRKDADNEAIIPSYMNALMTKVQSDQKSLELIHNDLKEDLHKEELALHDQIVSSRDFFKRYEIVLGEKYAQQMNKLFEYELQLDNASLIYFLSKPSASLAQIQQATSHMDKMKYVGTLWDDLIVGEAKFNSESGPQSINWQVMSNSLKNSLMMEAL